MGESAPSLEMVMKAISSLYNSPDCTEKADASRWLQQYQSSVYAWTISDQLLQRKLDLESCYFAAQTLRSKIQSSFHELPLDVHESLRNSLLNHLLAVTEETDSTIRTQLCLAMADLILLMPEWKNAVPELMTKLHNVSNTLTLLEVLMLLPEEVDSRHLRLGANRRQEIKDELKKCSQSLSQLLDSCLSKVTDNQLDVQNIAIKCYSSWLTIGVIDLQTVSTSAVIHLAVNILSHHASPASLHDSASDCIINLLTRLEKEDNEALEKQIFEIVMRFETPYHVGVSEEDLDKCLNYCRIFTETGESFLTRMVSNSTSPHFSIPVLDTVLMCCSHPDYEMPDITFNLWYRLSEELYSRNDDRLTAIFHPYVVRLIGCMSRHCQMEPDMVGVLSEDEDFSEFRSRVADLIKDCVFIVGSSLVFTHMYHQMKETNQWEQTEATLFVMQAVARNIHPEEKEIVPGVLEQVLNLTSSGPHQAVRVTATKLIGELSEWINRHPDTLQAVLQHLLVGLQDPVVASEAANSLESICSMCKEQMTRHFGGLLQILEQLDKFKLKTESAKGLVKGAALILSIMSEQQQLDPALHRICQLQLEPLSNLMNTPNQRHKIVRNSTGDPVVYLDRLADVFRYVSPSNGCRVPSPHPCKGVIEASWPILSQACDVYVDDERITERACRTVRFAVRCLGVQSNGILPSLASQLIRLYESHKHSCYLYLGSILIDEFASEADCISGLLEMVKAFISPTYSLLAKDHGLRDNPGTVDDFFRLNSRFLQRAPLPYLQTEFLNSVIECGLMSTTLDHRDANTSVMKFFETLFKSAHSRSDSQDIQMRNHIVGNLYKEFGGRLVETLVRSAVLTLPYYTYSDISDVLYYLSELDKVTFSGWLENTLKNLAQLNTQAVTAKQLEDFHQAVTKAEDPENVSMSLRDFVRLWR